MFVYKFRIVYLTLFIAISALVFGATATAALSDAMKALKQENYDGALSHFDQYLKNNPDIATTQYIRLNVWRAFLLLKKEDPRAETILVEVLCKGLAPAHLTEAIPCVSASINDPLDAMDQDLLAAAMVALATRQWRQSQYLSALKLYGNANTLLLQKPVPDKSTQLAKNARVNNTLGETAASLLDMSENLKLKHKQVEQYLLTPMLMRGLTGGKKQDKQSLQNNPIMKEYLSIEVKLMTVNQVLEMKCKGQEVYLTKYLQSLEKQSDQEMDDFIKKLNGASALPLDKEDCSFVGTTRAKSRKRTVSNFYAKNANEQFYALSKHTLCPQQEQNSTDIITRYNADVANTFGEAAEARRGNKFDSFALANILALETYNTYLDSADQLILAQDGTPKRRAFRKEIAKCGNRAMLPAKLSFAIESALKRNDKGLEFYQLALETMQKMADKSSKSTLNSASQILTIRRLMAQRYLAQEMQQKALGQLSKGLQVIAQATPHDLELSMSPWLRLLVMLSEQLRQIGASLGPVEVALDQVLNKQKKLATKMLKMASLDFQQRMAFQATQMLDKANLGEMFADVKLNEIATSAASKQGITLTPDMQKMIAQQMGGVSSQIQGFLDNKNLQQAINEGLPKMLTQVADNTPMHGASNDIMGTMVELERQAVNKIKMFELGVSEVYSAMGDTKRANTWVNKASSRDNIEQYSTRTLAYDAYIKAKIAQREKRFSTAHRLYKLSVYYWYSNPPSVLDAMEPVFPSATYLLETAAKFELEYADMTQSLHYIELARYANIDNRGMYGFVSAQALTKLRIKLENEYLSIVKQAQARAQQSNQMPMFMLALADSKKRRGDSTRGSIAPLLPLFTGLDPLLIWIEPVQRHRFVNKVEHYNNLWGNQTLRVHRKRLLVSEKNKSLERERESPSSAPVKPADTDNMSDFRSSKETAERVMLSEDLQQVIEKQSLVDIAALLPFIPEDVSMVSLWLTRDNLFVFHAKPGGLEGVLLKGEEVQPQIDAILEEIKLSLEENSSSVNKRRSPFDQRNAHLLFEKLFGRLEKPLNSRVILLVNGALQNIPFAALPMDKKGGYFGDAHLLSYLPNFERLKYPVSINNPKLRQVLVLAPSYKKAGDKLKNAKLEAKLLAKYYDTQVYSDQVTKATLQQLAGKYTMLHFAGHARLDDHLPDFSSLQMSMDKQGQSRFYIDDIKALDLHGMELVVLSGCESTKTNTYNLNSEFSTLSAAFMEAGAVAIVASIEKVGDKVTKQLMDKFYEQLAKGKAKDVALQTAQIYVREHNPDIGNHWAFFNLSGNVAPIAMAPVDIAPLDIWR